MHGFTNAVPHHNPSTPMEAAKADFVEVDMVEALSEVLASLRSAIASMQQPKPSFPSESALFNGWSPPADSPGYISWQSEEGTFLGNLLVNGYTIIKGELQVKGGTFKSIKKDIEGKVVHGQPLVLVQLENAINFMKEAIVNVEELQRISERSGEPSLATIESLFLLLQRAAGELQEPSSLLRNECLLEVPLTPPLPTEVTWEACVIRGAISVTVNQLAPRSKRDSTRTPVSPFVISRKNVLWECTDSVQFECNAPWIPQAANQLGEAMHTVAWLQDQVRVLEMN
jgi:hypothetical protein